MSHIRGHGNKSTELGMMQLMRENHITGWRRGSKLKGKPDFVFPRIRLAMFVDGCFWHGCPNHCSAPKQNAEFWQKKFGSNRARDRLVTRLLRSRGWLVLRIWEHELAEKKRLRLVNRLLRCIGNAMCRSSGSNTLLDYRKVY